MYIFSQTRKGWQTSIPRSEFPGNTEVTYACRISLKQGCPNSVLEGRCPAEFSSNPNKTRLNQLIKLLLGIQETSRQVCWVRLDLNSAGHRPSRTEFGHPWFKGIVHPQMKILSSFTHPEVVPNLYECLCFAENKVRYSEECGKQSSSGVFFFPTMEVNGAPKQPGYKLSSKYSFVFSRTKKFIQVWNYLRESKLWQNFHFGWTIRLSTSVTCRLCFAWNYLDKTIVVAG